MLKFNFRQRTIPVCRTDSKSSRASQRQVNGVRPPLTAPDVLDRNQSMIMITVNLYNFVIKVVFYEGITYNKSVIKNTKIIIKA